MPTCSRITCTTHHSNNSKAMIRELGCVELCELCETIPKVQCSHCLLYWNQGIVYCTCGQFLVDSESRKFNKLRLDALSVPHYVIKNGRCHGARHGKTEAQKEYHIAWNAWKTCCKKVDSQGEHLQVFAIDFSEIQFIVNHNSQSDGQNESAKRWTNLQKKTIHIISLPEEKRRYQGTPVSLTLNKSGKNGPTRLRSDFRAAVSVKNPLHRESGEQVEEPISPETTQEMTSFFKHIVVGTSLNGVGSELRRFFSSDLFFVTFGFVYSR